jgi:DNA-binding transcriptional LysR family regulator
MNRNFDLSLIRTFTAVADQGSMTAAANRLCLTQGAVSQHIKRLEELFGLSLFDRDRRLKLTPSGERFLRHAKRLLQANDEIWADMAVRPLHGKVRLGLPYDLVSVFYAPIIGKLTDAYPDLEIEIQCGSSPELAAGLADGSLDMAILEETDDQASGEHLRTEQLVWVGVQQGTAHLKRPLPLSMVADTCAFRPAVLQALADDRFEWRTVYESGNLEATIATVKAGLSVMVSLASTVPAELEILTLDAGLPALPRFQIGLHLPHHSSNPAAQELARYYHATFGAIAQAEECAMPAASAGRGPQY